MDYEVLLNCTIRFLELLLKELKTHDISYEDFEKLSALKMQFLRDHLHLIASSQDRAKADEILSAYEIILTV